MTITICHQKNPRQEMGWSVDDIMPRRDDPENLRILKGVDGYSTVEGTVGFSTIEACS